MKSPNIVQSNFSGSSHKGTTGLKKYSIELRVRVLEDLKKNGVGLKTVVETHQLADRRRVKYTLHRLQEQPM